MCVIYPHRVICATDVLKGLAMTAEHNNQTKRAVLAEVPLAVVKPLAVSVFRRWRKGETGRDIGAGSEPGILVVPPIHGRSGAGGHK